MSIPTNRFVNPYSFVPLPRTVRADREAPTWHDGRNAATVYSGTIGVEWTLRTPLLLPANALEEGWRKKSHIRIPGSSLAGAVRSLHETMFNGCMRVLDDTFVPAYREAAHSYPDLTLAIVSKADENGVPQELMLCRDPVWVDSLELLRHWPKDGELPTTGDLLRFRAAVVKVPGLNRKEIVNVGRVDVLSRAAKDTLPSDENMALGARVLIVSSTSARKKTKKNGQPARALWATAKPTGVRVPLDKGPGTPLEAFRAAVADTDDRRRLEKATDTTWQSQTTYSPVTWQGQDRRSKPVGRRANATGRLFTGDVVWVRTDNSDAPTKVLEIKLASIWRRPGKKPVGQRIPEHLTPCVPTETGGLCLSCAVFGAAETTGTTQHQQVSYAGHVRFSAAEGEANGSIQNISLAPLGAPRPGNGMFYLERYAPLRNPTLDEDDLIPTHWGSQDEKGTQRIAGRKFYWHSDPQRQAQALSATLGRPVKQRFEATDRQKAAMMSRAAELVPAGTVLRSTVAIDQLDAVGVHTLLAALDPQRALGSLAGSEQRRFATHLGGGKPFGLGSAEVRITGVDLAPLAQRYGAQGAPDVDWGDAPFPGRAVSERVGEITPNLASLAVMLDLDALGENAAIVSYPPGADWTNYSHSDPSRADRFVESYKFFGLANGQHLRRGDEPWLPLPRPNENPTLPIDPNRRP